MLSDTVLFTGNANPALSQEIATQLGVSLGKASVGRFSKEEGELDETVKTKQKKEKASALVPASGASELGVR